MLTGEQPTRTGGKEWEKGVNPNQFFYLTHLDENTKGGMRYIVRVKLITLGTQCNVSGQRKDRIGSAMQCIVRRGWAWYGKA